jgi:hypothetical protein
VKTESYNIKNKTKQNEATTLLAPAHSLFDLYHQQQLTTKLMSSSRVELR